MWCVEPILTMTPRVPIGPTPFFLINVHLSTLIITDKDASYIHIITFMFSSTQIPLNILIWFFLCSPSKYNKNQSHFYDYIYSTRPLIML
ncbi:uncharacterized protein DS421_11g350290 [Arachis hypogaea]|nr:uncharacterized protein DS421_11g350290 [Arachis hypogaea]